MNPDFARRSFLYQSLTGVGGIALLNLLNRDLRGSTNPLAPKTPHHTPKAKSCIFLTMLGGVSQMDTFDPKAGSREVRQHGDGLEQGEEHRSGQPVRQAATDSEERVSVREVWPVRNGRFQPVPASGDVRRRHGLRALHPDRERQSSGRGLPDEHRRGHSGQAVHGRPG